MVVFQSMHAFSESPMRLVFLGDSLTSGYTLDGDQSYPSLIQQKITGEKLPFTVVNSGISGDTTAGGLRRLDWLLRKPVHVLVIALGANDGLRGFDPRLTASNLSAIIKKARKANPEMTILLVGMKLPYNMGEAHNTKFQGIFPSLAREHDVELLPFLLEQVAGRPDLNLPDGMHPNEEGHAIMAGRMWNFLKPTLIRLQETQSKQISPSNK